MPDSVTEPRLAAEGLRPTRVYTRPEFASYPTRFNAAEELVGRQVRLGRGDHIAIRSDQGEISYADLWARAGRLAGGLRRLGVVEGDRVLIRSLNEPEALITNFAVLLLGAVVVPTSPLLTPEQLAHIARDCTPKVAVVSGRLVHAWERVRPAHGRGWTTIVYGPPAGLTDAVELDQLMHGESTEHRPVRRPSHAVSVLLYSSGLLEPAMATAHLQEELLIIPDGYGRHCWNIRPDDVVAGAGPISFAGGYSTLLTLPFRFGATAAVIPLSTTPAGMFTQVKRNRVTLLAALPSRYAEMLRVPDVHVSDLCTLRMVSGGGEPLDPDTSRQWALRFGLPIYEGFGTNGMMHVFLTAALGPQVVPGSLGRPLPGYHVRLVARDGTPAEPGTPGCLQVRGPVGTTFWGSAANADRVDERQRATTTFDGWTIIGDWMTQDDAGNLYFVARDEDLFAVNGDIFGPGQIEQTYADEPAFRDVGAYRAPGGSLELLIVPAEGFEADDVLERARAISQWEPRESRQPGRITVVESLPRTMFGTRLRRAVWSSMLAGEGISA